MHIFPPPLLPAILFAIFAFPYSTLAEDFYVAQTPSGSDTGADPSNAHAVSWFSDANNWATPKVPGRIGPGDTIHICGTITAAVNNVLFTFRKSGTPGNVITLKFETDALLQSPAFPTNGAININGNSYIKIDGGANGIIQNTDSGSVPSGKTYHLPTTGIYSNSGSNIEICNLTIQHLFINTGGDSSAATDTSGLLSISILIDDNLGNYSNINIHDNIINNSRAGVWVAYENLTVSGINIYNNSFADHCWMIVIGAGTPNSVATEIDIYGNTMTDWNLWQYPSSHYHTDGLLIFSNSGAGTSYYTGKFRSNYVYGSLGAGSPSGFIGSGCGGRNFLIYNNLFRVVSPHRGGSGMVVFNAGSTGCSAGQPVNTTFYNNTCIGVANGTGNNWEGLAIKIARPYEQGGSYMTVKNNIFVDYHHPLEDMNSDYSGFSGTGSTDYNLYYGHTHVITVSNSVTSGKSLAQFRASPYNQEIHGVLGNPRFMSSTDFRLQSDSPAKNAGLSLVELFSVDKDGRLRPSVWDIGAYEAPPAAPSNLRFE